MSDGQVRIGVGLDSSSVDGDLNTLKAKLTTSAGMIQGLMAGAIGGAILAVGNAALQSASKMEDFVAAFTPLTGGAENAKDMIAALNKEAASTPFELTDIANTAKQLLPVLGNDIQAVTKTFRMLGDAAGGNAQKLDSIARGYVKVMNTGKVSLEALNMISDAGVPIQSQLAKSMGITVEEMYKLSSQGKITADELTKTFQTMTKEGGLFFNGMEIASQTFSGKLSTMQDNLSQAAAVIGNQLLPAAKSVVDTISNLALGYVDLNKQLVIAEWNINNFFQKIATLGKQTALEAADNAYVQEQSWRQMTQRGNAFIAAEAKRQAEAAKIAKEAGVNLYAIQDDLVKSGLKLEADALNEKIKLREAEISNLEEAAKKTGEIDKKKYKEQLDALAGYRARLAQLGAVSSSDNPLGMAGPITKGEAEAIAGYASDTVQSFSMLLSPVEQVELGTRETADNFKEIKYTIEDGVVAGLSVASHLLQKMGNEDAKALAEALNSVSTIAANIGLAATGNPAAIASVAIAGIDLIANAWDQLWGKQSKAQKKAAEEARRAEEERIKAVRALEREYEAKFYSDIERLEKERDERVAYARSIGADVLNIERYYAGEIAKLSKARAEGTSDAEQAAAAKSAEIVERYRILEYKALREQYKNFTKNDTSITTKEQYDEVLKLLDMFGPAYAAKFREQLATISAEMRSDLDPVEGELASFVSKFNEAFTGVGSAISNGMKNGLDGFDIKDSIQTMLKNMAIDAAIVATGMETQFAAIGTAVAEALADGFFSSEELASITSLSDKLTTDALNVLSPIDALFGNLGGQLASGLVVDVAGATNTSQNIISLTATGVLNVDGKSLGTVVFQNWDQVTQGAYGA